MSEKGLNEVTYEQEVKTELQKLGKSFEWAEWALSRLDIGHYERKYTAREFAEVIVSQYKEDE